MRTVQYAWRGQAAPCIALDRLDVAARERIFIHGPSGSGKSTLLGLLGGVIVPQSGSIRLLGTELTQIRPSARDRFRADHIGFLFQSFNLVPYLSTIENVLLPCRFSARRRERATEGGRSVHQEARGLLRDLDVEPALFHRDVTTLSVGQQQRVAAARALLGRPEIIIADEPTSALDADRQAAFIQLLLRECADAGATVVFVSHDMRLAPFFTREIGLPGNGAHFQERAA